MSSQSTGREGGAPLSSQDYLWLAIGLASIAVAAGVVIVSIRLAALLGRAEKTLKKVEQQLDRADVPVTKTLNHVSSVAENVDGIVAKANHVADLAEKAAGAVAKTADAAQAAVTPTVANLVGVVVGVSQGAKAFFRSRSRNGPQRKETEER
jgi:uncharacterized protein YoxC